jgi:hypothetical protein
MLDCILYSENAFARRPPPDTSVAKLPSFSSPDFG